MASGDYASQSLSSSADNPCFRVQAGMLWGILGKRKQDGQLAEIDSLIAENTSLTARLADAQQAADYWKKRYEICRVELISTRAELVSTRFGPLGFPLQPAKKRTSVCLIFRGTDGLVPRARVLFTWHATGLASSARIRSGVSI
jgi:hypothetical protein